MNFKYILLTCFAIIAFSVKSGSSHVDNVSMDNALLIETRRQNSIRLNSIEKSIKLLGHDKDSFNHTFKSKRKS